LSEPIQFSIFLAPDLMGEFDEGSELTI
jgi:hypothetical protein